MEKNTLIKIGLALFAGALVYATPLFFQKSAPVEVETEQVQSQPAPESPPLEEILPVEEAEAEEEHLHSINYLEEQSIFELPLQGATAYASVDLAFRDAPKGNSLGSIAQGQGFTVLMEEGDYWLVDYQDTEGYVYANYCLLNLPDVIPSAIYDNTNGYASAFRSSFTDIPNVTNQQFYDSKYYNERLGYDQYTMAILYQTAKKVAQVQRTAMENGETLIINETYRPFFIQEVVVQNLNSLMSQNETVRQGVTTYPWSINWFISVGISKHQTGCAIDTSLGTILATEERRAGDYVYTAVTEYQELEMPTPIHELSLHSASETRDISYVEVEITPNQGEIQAESAPEGESAPPEGESAPPEGESAPPEGESAPQVPEPQAPTEDWTLPDLPAEPTPEPSPEPEPVAPTEPQVQPIIPGITETLGVSMAESQFFFGDIPIIMETLGEIQPSYETQTVYGPWRTSDTMTDDAKKLEKYFNATGMVSIYSEWWHFEDRNNQSNNESRGAYLLSANVSRPPVAPYVLVSES